MFHRALSFLILWRNFVLTISYTFVVHTVLRHLHFKVFISIKNYEGIQLPGHQRWHRLLITRHHHYLILVVVYAVRHRNCRILEQLLSDLDDICFRIFKHPVVIFNGNETLKIKILKHMVYKIVTLKPF